MKYVAIAILFLQGAQAEKAGRPSGAWFKNETSQFVFFAVLEGLYRDGLSTKTVELIVPRKNKGSALSLENFIINCPLCYPAAEAFRL
jgi:hypothetical protein